MGLVAEFRVISRTRRCCFPELAEPSGHCRRRLLQLLPFQATSARPARAHSSRGADARRVFSARPLGKWEQRPDGMGQCGVRRQRVSPSGTTVALGHSGGLQGGQSGAPASRAFVLWDVENVPPASGIDAQAVVEELEQAAVAILGGGPLKMRFRLFADVERLARPFRKQMTRMGVMLVDNGVRKAEQADKHLERCLVELVDDFGTAERGRTPTAIILVTSDLDFATAGRRVREAGMPIGLVIPDPTAASRATNLSRPAPSFRQLRTAVGPMGGSPFGPVPVLARRQPLPAPTSPGAHSPSQLEQRQHSNQGAAAPAAAAAAGGSAANPSAARRNTGSTAGPRLPAAAPPPAQTASRLDTAPRRSNEGASGRRRSDDPAAPPPTMASAPSPGAHLEDPTSPGAPGAMEHEAAAAAAAAVAAEEEADGDRQQRLLDRLWPLVRCMVGVALVPLLQGGTPPPGPDGGRGVASATARARGRAGDAVGRSGGGSGGRRAGAQASRRGRGRSTSGGRVAGAESARGAAAAAAMLLAAAAPAPGGGALAPDWSAQGAPSEHGRGHPGRDGGRGGASVGRGPHEAGRNDRQYDVEATPLLSTPAAARGRATTPRTDDGDPAVVAPSPFVSDEDLRAATGKPCRECGRDRFQHEFSRTQWRKRIGDGLCLECTDAHRQSRSTSVQPARGRAAAAEGRAERDTAPERRGRSVGPALGGAPRGRRPHAERGRAGGEAAAAAASAAAGSTGADADSDSEAELAKPARAGVATGQQRRTGGAFGDAAQPDLQE